VTELHLLEYNQTKLEYLHWYEAWIQQISLFPAPLKAFIGPWDQNGYRDKSITDDLITDVYTAFSDETRSSESQDDLWMLEGKQSEGCQMAITHHGI
jgi:hypothetical protein